MTERGLLAGGIGNHNAAWGLLLFGFTLDHDPVVQWTDVHGNSYLFE
jgi:hypothetical protein